MYFPMKLLSLLLIIFLFSFAFAQTPEELCANGLQDSGEEGIDCGIVACGIPCYNPEQPIQETVPEQTPLEQPSEQQALQQEESPIAPVGYAGGYQEVFAIVKSYAGTFLLLMIIAGVLVGLYVGYPKLYQGHYAETPPQVTFNAQLYTYIKECREKGFPREMIYTKLKELQRFNDDDLQYHLSLAEERLQAK